eukprot:EG_transcript_258
MEFSACVGSELLHLVHGLTKQNFNASVAEIDKFLIAFGVETTRHLLGYLVHDVHSNALLEVQHRENLKLRLLNYLLSRLPKDPHFISVASDLLDSVEPAEPGAKYDFLAQLCRLSNLPLVVQLALGLALAHSHGAASQRHGVRFLKAKLGEVTANVVQTLPDNVLHHLLHFVSNCRAFSNAERTLLNLEAVRQSLLSLNALGASAREISAAKRRRDGDVGLLAVELAGSLSLAGVLRDVGCAATACRESLAALLEAFPQLSAAHVAQAVGVIVGQAPGPEKPDDNTLLVHDCYMAARAPRERNGASSSGAATWNVDVFVSAITDKYTIDWREVLRGLDHAGFRLPSQRSLALLLALYRRATGDAMPVDPLFGRWRNRAGQLQLLQALPAAPPDLIDWTCRGAPHARTVRLETLPCPAVHAMWASVDLVETLLDCEGEPHASARGMFDAPLRACPDWLLLSLLHARPARPNLRGELLQALLPSYVLGTATTPTAARVLPAAAAACPEALAAAVLGCVAQGALSAAAAVDFAATQSFADPLLACLDHPTVTFEVAVLAASRGLIGLGEWLGSVLRCGHRATASTLVAKVALNWLAGVIETEADRVAPGPKADADAEATAAPADPGAGAEPVPAVAVTVLEQVFAALAAAGRAQQLPPLVVERSAALLREARGLYPTLLMGPAVAEPGATAAAASSASAAPADGFTPSVEGEANSCFGRIYSGDLTVEELVALLERYRGSTDSRELEIYRCMVHNLLDEYRFFPKYPEKELHVTARLFGSVIARSLLDPQELGTAMRYVLQALARPANTRMQKFGATALEAYKGRLREWPLYCSHLQNVPNLSQLVPGIDAFLQPEAPPPPAPPAVRPPASSPSLPKPPVLSPVSAHSTADGGGFGHTLDIGTLLAGVEVYEVPAEVADKLSFLLNNVMEANLEFTAMEMRRFLQPAHLPFLAQHLVMKRASLEPNYHRLYGALVDALALKELETLVLATTYSACKALLASEKVRTSSSERTLLKNLGSWLGLLTIARSKPLLTKHLSPKEMLLDGLQRGMLIVVVPFVCKVLEHCATSKVFRYPNPWMMGVIMLLCQIHALPDLKLTLKFEVEVLLKNLELDMANVEETIALNPDAAMAQQLEETYRALDRATSSDFMSRDPRPLPTTPTTSTSSLPVSPSDSADFRRASCLSTGSAGSGGAPAAPLRPLPAPPVVPSLRVEPGGVHPALPGPVWLPSSLPAPLATQPALPALVTAAIGRALTELGDAVVERSVMIACTTTRELATKDFATDPNDGRLLHSAQLMAQGLAASLATASSRDPLKAAIVSQLQALFAEQFGVAPEAQPEELRQAAEAIARENLELAVAAVRQRTAEEAARAMPLSLEPVMAERRAARDAGVPYWPPSAGGPVSQEFCSLLPDLLRRKQGEVYPLHCKVYSDFLAFVGPAASIPGDPAAAAAQQELSAILEGVEAEATRHYKAHTPASLQDVLSLTSPTFTQGSLSPEHDRLKELVSRLHPLMREDTALGIARNVLQRLFGLSDRIAAAQRSTSGPPSAELYVLMLVNEVCLFLLQTARERQVEAVTRELTAAFLTHDHCWQHKYIAVNFIRLRLINMPEFDRRLAEALQEPHNPKERQVVDFAGAVVQRCLVAEQLVPQQDLRRTLDVLGRLAKAPRADGALPGATPTP